MLLVNFVLLIYTLVSSGFWRFFSLMIGLEHILAFHLFFFPLNNNKDLLFVYSKHLNSSIENLVCVENIWVGITITFFLCVENTWIGVVIGISFVLKTLEFESQELLLTLEVSII